MPISNNSVTLLDIQLARLYYPILVGLAQQKCTISYGELVAEAKRRFPQEKCLESALAVSTGRRLDVVRQFTNDNNLPDVSSLVVNRAKGECGRGFTDNFNPEKVRMEVFAVDWTRVTTDFDAFIVNARIQAVRAATPPKRPTQQEARRMNWEYYKANKNTLPASIAGQRDKVVSLIMQGNTVEDAYLHVCGELGEGAIKIAA